MLIGQHIVIDICQLMFPVRINKIHPLLSVLINTDLLQKLKDAILSALR